MFCLFHGFKLDEHEDAFRASLGERVLRVLADGDGQQFVIGTLGVLGSVDGGFGSVDFHVAPGFRGGEHEGHPVVLGRCERDGAFTVEFYTFFVVCSLWFIFIF